MKSQKRTTANNIMRFGGTDGTGLSLVTGAKEQGFWIASSEDKAVGGPMSSGTSKDGFGRSRRSHLFVFDANKLENFLPVTGARNGFIGSRQYVVYLRDTRSCQVLDEYLPAL